MSDAKQTRVRNKRAEITENVADGSVTWKFFDGGPDFVARLSDLPQPIVTQLAVSRIHNKLMDTYADPGTEPRHEVMACWTELKAGTWSQRGEAGPKRPTLLIEALAEVYKRSPESVEAWLNKQSEEFVASLKKKSMVNDDGTISANPIYAKMEDLKARRARERANALKKQTANISLASIDIPE